MNQLFPYMFLATVPRSRRKSVARTAVPLVATSGGSPFAGALGVLTVDNLAKRAEAYESRVAADVAKLVDDGKVDAADLRALPSLKEALDSQPELRERVLPSRSFSVSASGASAADRLDRRIDDLAGEVHHELKTLHQKLERAFDEAATANRAVAASVEEIATKLNEGFANFERTLSTSHNDLKSAVQGLEVNHNARIATLEENLKKTGATK